MDGEELVKPAKKTKKNAVDYSFLNDMNKQISKIIPHVKDRGPADIPELRARVKEANRKNREVK